jgi:uncharacterized protein (DUF1778 family)
MASSAAHWSNSMTDYKATPEQWEHVHICAGMKHQVPWATADCLLELRARIELLEAAAQKHIVETSANILALASRVEALEAAERQASKVHEISEPLKLTPEQAQQITDLLTPNSSAPLTSSNYPAKPDGSLVRRVALAISGVEYGLELDEEAVNWASEARAAIREVAAWLIDRRRDDDWLAPFEELAELLQEEADQ